MLLQTSAWVCFGAAGIASVAYAFRLLRQRTVLKAGPAPTLPTSSGTAPNERLSGSAENWCKVLDGESLLQHCHAQATIDEIRRQSRLAPIVFDRDLRAALVAYAEFVQLVPASESHHHAHPGGLLAHTLEVVLAAMTQRNGYLLPLHAPTETIDRTRDHWTFAVFLAALLHDIGKIMTDLRLVVRDTPKSPTRLWLPMSGALTQSRACEYKVGFAPSNERDYQAHRKLALVLLQGIVPANTLAFIGRENVVLESLTAFLGSEEKPGSAAADGAKTLAQIIKKADGQSVAHNLQHGPRNRFSTATTIPLIERLMSAMRAMLAQGTMLPLNRDGAAGWVYDGAIWFVAKRLADSVRSVLVKEEPEDGALGGVPGPTKNDRLFDTWQDYGACELNPATGQAIWHVLVSGEGYSHRFAVLKFPLYKLYDEPARYPQVMQGSIAVVARDEGGSTSTKPAPEPVAQSSEHVEQGAAPVMPDAPMSGPPRKAHGERGGVPSMLEPDGDLLEPGDVIAPPANPPSAPNQVAMLPTSPQSDGQRGTKAGKHTANLADIPAPRIPPRLPKKAAAPSIPATKPVESVVEQSVPKPEASIPAPPVAPPAEARGPVKVAPAVEADQSGLLDAADATGRPARKKAPKAHRAAGAPSSAPVSPYAVAPKLPGDPEPTPLAIAFMEWLQQGLASGTLTYNEPGAQVHFIALGMALVSPRIFREYAKSVDADANAVQQQVIGAGWHVKAAGNSNILHFAVIKRDGTRASKLSVVVIAHPERWVNPLPPQNACLVPFELSVDVGAVAGNQSSVKQC